MVKVKFCGLKRPCDIAWANELRPDYAGFVFAGKKRRVSDDQAAALRKTWTRASLPSASSSTTAWNIWESWSQRVRSKSSSSMGRRTTL